MNTAELDKVVQKRVDDLWETLSKKGQEYAPVDRLANFKKAGAMKQETPEKALWGMVTKHIIALQDFIEDLDIETVKEYPFWNEKIGDIICYCILLDALIQERIQLKENIIEDGFGSAISKTCPMCGKDSMQVVRPGKFQCQYCG